MENNLSPEQIKEKRLEVLEDVVKYFNSNTRNATPDNTCKYLPITSKSEGCAIGRLIKDKELCARLDKGDNYSSGVSHEEIFSQLPDELKILGVEFLAAIQGLHDDPSNWDINGLTGEGKRDYNYIKMKYIE